MITKEKNLQSFYLHAKKSLGQNFLNDKAIIDRIALSINSLFANQSNKYVHEIGPGAGALTSALLEKEISILGIEKDERAIKNLIETLGKSYARLFQVVHADILKWNPKEDDQLSRNGNPICVGNIPYYITSDILLWFCNYKNFYNHGVFMVQDEVADRLKAEPSTKDYGRLTVKLQLNFFIEKLFVVPAHCFVPRPKVNSAIVHLIPKPFSLSAEEDKIFGNFTTILFGARRKMLRRALASQLSMLKQKGNGSLENFWKLVHSFGVTEDTRPDTLSPECILALHKFFLNS